MTLEEIAEYCAAMTGMKDNVTRADALSFAKFRWKMIWGRAFWVQSKMEQPFEVAAEQKEVLLGTEFDFAVAARWGRDRELIVTSDITLLRTAPLALDTTGSVMGFDPLPRTNDGARIRLYYLPKTADTLLVIGKRRCPELDASFEPNISGGEETLTAFVLGDLQRKRRQYAKANEHYAEATGHLANMLAIEREQAASDMRIVPHESVTDGEYENWLSK